MPTVRDRLDAYPDLMAQPWFGTIAKAPVDFTHLVTVIIPAFDAHLTWGPARWQARDATSLPAAGDPCLVIFDDERQPWVVAWWPF